MPRGTVIQHCIKRKAGTTAALILLITCLSAAPVEASPERSAWRYDVAVTSFHLPEATLDAGGKTNLTSYHFKADARRRINSGSSIGFVFRYGYYDREFSGGGFAALQPWGDTQRLALNTLFLAHLNDEWTYGIRPFVSSFSESGDINSDTVSYGVSIAAVSHWTSDRHLGLGIRAAHGIDGETKLLPFVIVNWRFNDQWRIRNPSEPDLIGAAGLELNYQPGERWELSLLGVYHSPDFRLDESGLAPGGIGEHEGAVALARVNRRWESGLILKGYLGVVIGGTLEVRDARDRVVARTDYDTAPLAGIALERSF
jgi:hypothetical protein